ncbi:DNA-binding protein [Pseudomonas sp. ITA]|uniref:hypothetical protein n=1 Tax=Pseudomonas sp. ITA TaxID=2825841 RepID=UPI002498B6B3|nr:hypothetical protein [Pseudomonas sp. ITA]MDI2144914.1 DNA-binding protein [Pseudomonas sp. ITA]
MRESPISNQDIVDAGNSILATGRAVNGYSLRNAIGSGRADRLMRIWTEHIELAGSSAAGSISIPARAQALISSYVKRQEASVNQLLQELAVVLNEATQSAVQEEMESLKASVEQQRNALLDADLLIDRLEQTNLDLENQIRVEKDNCDQMRTALAKMEDQARKDSSALDVLNRQLVEAQEQVSSLRESLEDEKAVLGRCRDEVLRLEERVAGLVESAKQQDFALLDARRESQVSREREATVNGQMLQLQRDRDADLEIITRLRLEVGTAATRVSQSEAEANAYKEQLAQLNDRVGGLLSTAGPGASHE